MLCLSEWKILKKALFCLLTKKCNLPLLERLGVLKQAQTDGVDGVPKIKIDSKDFELAQILHDLHISKLKLMTNTFQTKRVGMIGYGLEITDYIEF